MARMVLGIFTDRWNAEDAIRRLHRSGFNPQDISIMMKNTGEAKIMAEQTGVSEVVGGTVSGAAAGGVIGALAGILVANGVIPGLGAFLIGGPLAAALGLTGTVATAVSGATTGALAGGLLGALTSWGLSDEDAKIYEQRVRAGGILLAVFTREGEEGEVRAIMEEMDATDVKSVDHTDTQREMREEVYREDYHSPVVAHELRRGRRKRRKG